MESPEPTSGPLVSVVVPTHNRAEGLERSIAGVLAGSDGVDAEVIYVDDASGDDTPRILAEHVAAGRIRSIRVECGAPGPARNAGAALARGTYLLFTDDDCEVPEGWAAGMLAARERRGVEALSGGFRPARMETAAERYYEHRMRTLYADRARPVRAVPAMNLLVDRTVFDELEGYSPLRLPSMEDWEFSYRLVGAGHQLFYDPEVRVEHAYGRDWRYVRRRVFEAAWLAPAVWRLSGLPMGRKLARDALRAVAAPLWCLTYYPIGLYAQAVALEVGYFAVRVVGVVAARRVERRIRAR